MMKFAQSKRILFIVCTLGLLLVIVLWHRSASDRRFKAEAESSPLSCALYAAKKSGNYNSGMVCKVAVAFAEAGDLNRAYLIINEIKETEYFLFHPRGLRFQFSDSRTFFASGRILGDAATRLAQDGKYDLALGVTRAIVTDGIIFDDGGTVPSQHYRAEAVVEIAILYARTGPKEEEERRKFLRQLLTLIE